jgi:benzodiazapine receptor
MEFKSVAAGIGIVLVLIYALGSGFWVNNAPGWYTSLNRPSWQPPDFVFGLIWTYNFVILGVAAVRVSNTLSRSEVIIWLGAFALSVVAALSWAYHFYVPHQLQIAAFSLAATAILTLPMLLLTFRVSVALGLALLPYQIWVAIATTLSWGYYLKN